MFLFTAAARHHIASKAFNYVAGDFQFNLIVVYRCDIVIFVYFFLAENPSGNTQQEGEKQPHGVAHG